MRALLTSIVVVLAVVLGAREAHAHAMRSGYVELAASADGTYDVRLRTSVRGTSFALEAPRDCHFADGATRLAPLPESLAGRGRLSCASPLAGKALEVRGLDAGLSEIVVLYEPAGGPRATALLVPGSAMFVVPGGETDSPFGNYVRLGIAHIAHGSDHLVFLLLLVLTLRRLRPVLLAETAFTFSHAISFSLTATGLVRVPAAPTEALIALSVVMLALDAPKRDAAAAKTFPTAALALVFGSVHGLGFAGGLREIGLPERDVASALAGFAVGVEIGQVAFVVLVVALGAALVRFASKRGSARLLGRGRELVIVGAGGYAALLLVSRVVATFNA